MKKIIALLLAALMVVTMFAACGKKDEEPSQPNVSVDATQGDAEGDEAGFEEIEIFSDEEVGFMNVNAVYFQPVPMSGGYENYEDFDLHLECDVSALENSLGYGLGDWVPYLTVDYEVIASDGSTAADGAFMVMAASDGPHYGANIKLPNADTYSLKFTFHSPAENGYVIHLDDVTGPGGTLDDYFANGPLVLEMPDCWNYIPREW